MRELTSDEYYTPDWLMELPPAKKWLIDRVEGPFMDTNCGQGNWLFKILQLKLDSGIDHETALKQIYGVEFQQDSAEVCKTRLLCGREDLRHIVEQNIVCADALRYHYRFDGSHPYDDEVREQEKEELFKSLEIDQCKIVSAPKIKKTKLTPLNLFE
jgi:hypothetical protein